MSIVLRQNRPRRPLSLTPMIDVVFLLLVFFMLTAQFDRKSVINLGSQSGVDASGDVPRLVDVDAGRVRLNGVAVDRTALVESLMKDPDALVVVRANDGVNVQRLVDVLEALGAGGLVQITVIE